MAAAVRALGRRRSAVGLAQGAALDVGVDGPLTASPCRAGALAGQLTGAIHDATYDRRPRSGQDGLFAKDKFCLIRRGRLVLAQRRARSGPDRALPGAGAAVPRGFRPLGAGHEAAAVDRAPAAGRPSNGTTAAGQGLSGASAGRRRARRPAGSSRPLRRTSRRRAVMQVAGYVRVSSRSQARTQTIDQQIDRLHAHAAAQSWALAQDRIVLPRRWLQRRQSPASRPGPPARRR